MQLKDELRGFMTPQSVALIGVTPQRGEGSFNVMENLLRCGYEGRVYPVNPTVSEVLGVKTFASIGDVAEVPELATIILGNRNLIPGIVKECVEKGIKAIVVLGQGFADADEEGRRMQEEMVRTARERGARIVGPNTMGTANAFFNFSTGLTPFPMSKMAVGVICQSGIAFTGSGNIHLLGKGFDLGNACDVDFVDALQYFEDDPEVQVIVLHVEGLNRGKDFMKVAKRVTWHKPILALKTGRSERGAQAARSHTGSLTGRDEVYDAAFKQCGIIRVGDFDELWDLVRAFLYLPPMQGRQVGVISFSGASGTMTADASALYGLGLSNFTENTLREFKAMTPPWMDVRNPVDIMPAALVKGDVGAVFTGALDKLLWDEDVNGIMYIVPSFPIKSWQGPRGLPPGIHLRRKPVVCWLVGDYQDELREEMDKRGLLIYPTVGRGIKALAALAHYQEFRNRQLQGHRK